MTEKDDEILALRKKILDSCIGSPTCICNSKQAHFCVPFMKEPGFYACQTADIVANMQNLSSNLWQLVRWFDDSTRSETCTELQRTIEEARALVKQ